MKDFLNVGGVKGRLAQCFSHTYRRHTYGFLVIDVVEPVGEVIDTMGHIEYLLDPVLDLPVYRISGIQTIYGLSSTTDDLLYLIQAPYEPDWQDDDEEYLLECDWGVNYL